MLGAHRVFPGIVNINESGPEQHTNNQSHTTEIVRHIVNDWNRWRSQLVRRTLTICIHQFKQQQSASQSWWQHKQRNLTGTCRFTIQTWRDNPDWSCVRKRHMCCTQCCKINTHVNMNLIRMTVCLCRRARRSDQANCADVCVQTRQTHMFDTDGQCEDKHTQQQFNVKTLAQPSRAPRRAKAVGSHYIRTRMNQTRWQSTIHINGLVQSIVHKHVITHRCVHVRQTTVCL